MIDNMIVSVDNIQQIADTLQKHYPKEKRLTAAGKICWLVSGTLYNIYLDEWNFIFNFRVAGP